MTVRITDADAFDRICAVEGEGYRSLPHALEGPESFASHIALFDEWVRDLAQCGHDPYSVGSGFASDTIGEAIYGLCGYHRYFVRGDGRIVFSRHHATASGRARATAAGFDLF